MMRFRYMGLLVFPLILLLVSVGHATTTNQPTFARSQEISLSTGATKVAVGSRHACALLSNGEVFCWGANDAAQLGIGTWDPESLRPKRVIELPQIVDLVAGDMANCALTVAGGVKCWGHNEFGELGNGTFNWSSLVPVDVDGLSSGVVSLAAGFYHMCALSNTGEVKCWGRNEYGQLGDGTTTDSSTPLTVGLSGVATSIAAGFGHTCALMSGGTVSCWGDNWAGQLGNGTFENSLVPVSVMDLSPLVKVISAGLNHTCATSGIGVKCWGLNWWGQLGDGTFQNRPMPVNVVSLSEWIIDITTGEYFSCALTSLGGVKCWGRNSEGQLGDGTRVDRDEPISVSGLATGVIDITSSKRNSSCAVLGSGSIKCWGMNDAGQVGDGTAARQVIPGMVTGATGVVTDLGAGVSHNCLSTNSGKVACWGFNLWGQLGDGSRTDSNSPKSVNGMSDALTVTLGDSHSCVLTNKGGIKCWGGGFFGQLGHGSWNSSYFPVDVSGMTGGILQVDAGWFHTCAVTTTGALKCWGLNRWGQIGDGTTDDRVLPVTVEGLSGGVVSVTAGYGHTCALLSNGTVKCWGRNSYGQLGDGTTNSSLVPVQVLEITNAISLSAGIDHTCALTVVGGVKCWGSNGPGQLGDGTWINRSTPVDVDGLTTGVDQVVAGGFHTCALTEEADVLCWGRNGSGQLGYGYSFGNIRVPVFVTNIPDDVVLIDAGSDHTCALLSDNDLYCWGSNGYGQLGLGDVPWKVIPVNVMFHWVQLPLIIR